MPNIERDASPHKSCLLSPHSRPLIAAASLALTVAAVVAPAHADDFYKGKQLNILIAFQAGSGYDVYGRTLGRHIAKYIPGHPTIVPNNMPGGGGIVVANNLYNLAPKDGTTIGLFSRSNNLDPLFGTPQAKFDPRKLSWLGSMGDEVSICISWHASKFKTWEDLKKSEFVAASTSNSADTGVYPTLFNELLGTKFKVVNGYKGGPSMSKAIESGEADGRCGWSWSAAKATKLQWVKDKKIHILLQAGLDKASDLPNVPLALDLATDPKQRDVMELAFTPQAIAWAFSAPPGVPADRLAILRKAFEQTLKDKDFLSEANRQQMNIKYMPGDEVLRRINKLYASPSDIVAKAKSIMKPQQK
ncbi:MAG: Bug family tripartite tricarboxylate transporter substrate binding protein [Hyphomicrobiaceae bacterium]